MLPAASDYNVQTRGFLTFEMDIRHVGFLMYPSLGNGGRITIYGSIRVNIT
jgi:hypothetical protein